MIFVILTFVIIQFMISSLVLFGIIKTCLKFKKINQLKIDVNKKKQIQTMLDMSMKAAKIGFWELKLKNNELNWNDEMVEIFGGVNVKNFDDFLNMVHKKDVDRIELAVRNSIKNNIPYQESYNIIWPNKQERFIEARGQVVEDVFVGVAIDLTDQCKMLDELKSKNEELEKFAYIASHDLKAPVRSICSLVAWIEEDLDKLEFEISQDTIGYLRLLSNRSKRMEKLIEGILEYSRAGRINLHKTLVDTNLIVKNIIKCHDQVEFEVHQLPYVISNEMKLTQIFSNLIDNAIKHNDKSNPCVEIGCEEIENFYKFWIKDNGPGINEKYYDKIFEIFQTLKPKDQVESTGIGLTLVKKIVELKGGEIGLESDVEKGAKFWFTLPR